jgi:hypothetical protein
MAEATTHPRSRPAKADHEAHATHAKTTPAKATKAAPAAAAPIKREDGRFKNTMVLEYTGDTMSYGFFVPRAGWGCVGKFYAPLVSEEV